MAKLDPNNPQHLVIRNRLRVIGPVVLAVGVICFVAGAFGFFISFGTMEPPHLIWAPFVGILLIPIGGAMCQMGYMGAFARYIAREGGPVATQTFNYAADETREGIQTITGAIAEGLHEHSTNHRHCTQCGAANDLDARFCKVCGKPLNPS